MIGDTGLKIAVGHDNQAGYQSIIEISVDGTKFHEPTAWWNYNPAQFKIRSNGNYYIRGKPVTAWVFTYMTKAQYKYLSDTYCNSEWDGDVTIRTRLADSDSFVDINARMRLPKQSELQNRLGKVGPPIRITFSNFTVI